MHFMPVVVHVVAVLLQLGIVWGRWLVRVGGSCERQQGYETAASSRGQYMRGNTTATQADSVHPRTRSDLMVPVSLLQAGPQYIERHATSPTGWRKRPQMRSRVGYTAITIATTPVPSSLDHTGAANDGTQCAKLGGTIWTQTFTPPGKPNV